MTITGANFLDATSVDFGDTPAGFTVNDESSITAESPAAEEVDTVDVTVVTVGGTSPSTTADQFVYTSSLPEPGRAMQLFSGVAGLIAIAVWREFRRPTT